MPRWIRRMLHRRAERRLLEMIMYGYRPESERQCEEIWERELP